MKGYELKISLVGSKPTIYRKVIVPSGLTFSRLHKVIQLVMGWDDTHLYEFTHKVAPEEIAKLFGAKAKRKA